MRPSTTLRLLPLWAAFATSIQAQSLGLGIEVTKAIDCARKTKDGDRISVAYKGTLESNGDEFDSSFGREPFTFVLGKGQVIKGWDRGLLDMCIGEARKLKIPPELAYGSSGSGPIPPDSTLIFETELVRIEGVEPEPVPERPVAPQVVPAIPSRPTIDRPQEPPKSAETLSEAPTPTSSPSSTSSTSSATPPSTAVAAPTTSAAAVADPVNTATQANPMDNNDNECHLLGPYALLVQGALGLLAVTILVYKRWRESPRRPVKIWFFDVSKQVFGSALLHLANILMSMLSSGSFDVSDSKAAPKLAGADDGDQPNPCSFYLLNITIDTTIGIPILVLLLKLLHRGFLLTPMANPPESIRSGNYGHPPRVTWWLKQSLIYFFGLFGMKLCVFFIFQLLPWIAWVGDWALRWTEGNEAIQITFVMFIFPLIMNALQYWIIDGFIKDKVSGPDGSYMRAAGEESSDDEEEALVGDDAWLERHRRERRSEGHADEDSDDEPGAEEVLDEANPTPVPVRHGAGKAREYDPGTDGA